MTDVPFVSDFFKSMIASGYLLHHSPEKIMYTFELFLGKCDGVDHGDGIVGLAGAKLSKSFLSAKKYVDEFLSENDGLEIVSSSHNVWVNGGSVMVTIMLTLKEKE